MRSFNSLCVEKLERFRKAADCEEEYYDMSDKALLSHKKALKKQRKKFCLNRWWGQSKTACIRNRACFQIEKIKHQKMYRNPASNKNLSTNST